MPHLSIYMHGRGWSCLHVCAAVLLLLQVFKSKCNCRKLVLSRLSSC
uniref:Uncharacterized protein n=1 Tax=Amphimedon queenslandica TaxID=400682 RepID=A0A1X7SV86_AMPQE